MFCCGSLNCVVGATPAPFAKPRPFAKPVPFATPVFLNKLAACYFAKCLCVSEMRKQTHAKSHEKTWDLAGHLVSVVLLIT